MPVASPPSGVVESPVAGQKTMFSALLPMALSSSPPSTAAALFAVSQASQLHPAFGALRLASVARSPPLRCVRVLSAAFPVLVHVLRAPVKFVRPNPVACVCFCAVLCPVCVQYRTRCAVPQLSH